MTFKESRKNRQGKLLSYTIASGDMRYIEISQRDIYLRLDPQRGLIIRGEVPECGLDCYVNLSYILLEQAMTCSGCKDPEMAREIADQFGRRLGEKLANRLCQDDLKAEGKGPLGDTFEVILNSMDTHYQQDRSDVSLVYDLQESPLIKEAKKHGFSQWTPMARQSFVALCESVIATLQPTWELLKPSSVASGGPIQQIAIAIK